MLARVPNDFAQTGYGPVRRMIRNRHMRKRPQNYACLWLFVNILRNVCIMLNKT